MKNLYASAQQKLYWDAKHEHFLFDAFASKGETIVDGGCIRGDRLENLNRLADETRLLLTSETEIRIAIAAIETERARVLETSPRLFGGAIQ